MSTLSDLLNKITLGDCLPILRSLPDNSVDLILTDPPYYKIVANEWDRQWKTLDEFRAWVGELAAEFSRILKNNGSLYWFCDDKVGAYCQIELDRHFSLLNNLVWRKPCTQAAMSKWSGLRSFAPCSERCLFYEQKDAAGLPATGLERIFSTPSCFESLKNYMRAGRDAVKNSLGFSTTKEFDEWVSAVTNTRSMAAHHYFADSQWQLPTLEHYHSLQTAAPEAFPREYESLRLEYESLRLEYESLRLEYESLRRPWNNHPDADEVLAFPQESPPLIHPTQKPLKLIAFLMERATRPDAVVLDPFSGSGTTAIAAHSLGLNFIAIERDPDYHRAAVERLNRHRAQLLLPL